MVPERHRVHNGGQRRTARVRHQALRGVHGRGQVPRFHQEEYAMIARRSDTVKRG